MAQLDLANLADAQVYCGTWAKYNAGSLFGKWMRLADYSDYEEFIKACRELHKDEEDPEFDLQDYEYIDEGLAGNLFISNLYWELLEVINDNPHTDWDMITAFINAYGRDIETADDLEDIISDAEDRFAGHYASDEEFAEETSELPYDLPSWIENNIDWKGVAYDLMFDYTEEDGYYFRD